MAYVALYIPGAEPSRVSLRPVTIVGRSSECDVWVNDPNVSRRHCKLQQDGQRWLLIDLQSTNGTWLDAARVRRYALRDGETFYIGDSRIVFHADQWIENRPADPNEASQFAQMLGQVDPNAQTHVEIRGKRRLPTPRVCAGAPAACAPHGAVGQSIAFRRPPARPIVRQARSGGWTGALIARLRGQ